MVNHLSGTLKHLKNQYHISLLAKRKNIRGRMEDKTNECCKIYHFGFYFRAKLFSKFFSNCFHFNLGFWVIPKARSKMKTMWQVAPVNLINQGNLSLDEGTPRVAHCFQRSTLFSFCVAFRSPISYFPSCFLSYF